MALFNITNLSGLSTGPEPCISTFDAAFDNTFGCEITIPIGIFDETFNITFN